MMALPSCSSDLLFFQRSLSKTHSRRHRYLSRSERCLSLVCSSTADDDHGDTERKKLSKQSSWEATDSEGNDYLYRLGQEADNMNIAVGARQGVIDDLFVGNFLGKDADIVFDYRQKVTRSFQYLQGDYYIAPAFMEKVGKLYKPSLEKTGFES